MNAKLASSKRATLNALLVQTIVMAIKVHALLLPPPHNPPAQNANSIIIPTMKEKVSKPAKNVTQPTGMTATPLQLKTIKLSWSNAVKVPVKVKLDTHKRHHTPANIIWFLSNVQKVKRRLLKLSASRTITAARQSKP